MARATCLYLFGIRVSGGFEGEMTGDSRSGNYQHHFVTLPQTLSVVAPVSPNNC